MRMKAEDNYLQINKTAWNKRTEIHFTSNFYDVEGFLNGKSSLNAIELELLGYVSNKKILHLQCHFGQDTLSLSRLGANVIGVDLSDKAIEAAKELTNKLNTNTQFICCDVYDLPNHLNETFDIVFTSYGTIGWLPDLNKWAKVISHFLKPGGKLVFVEFHPVVWMFSDDFKSVAYNYFNEKAIVETLSGTYADKASDIKEEYVSWNHSLSEVFTSLIQNGLSINAFKEYDYSPYNCFNETVEFEAGKFRIKHFDNKIPMVYALIAEKN